MDWDDARTPQSDPGPQGVEKLEHYLERKGRPGLQIGLRRLVGELTLLGFVSLILILFQDSLTTICGRGFGGWLQLASLVVGQAHFGPWAVPCSPQLPPVVATGVWSPRPVPVPLPRPPARPPPAACLPNRPGTEPPPACTPSSSAIFVQHGFMDVAGQHRRLSLLPLRHARVGLRSGVPEARLARAGGGSVLTSASMLGLAGQWHCGRGPGMSGSRRCGLGLLRACRACSAGAACLSHSVADGAGLPV